MRQEGATSPPWDPLWGAKGGLSGAGELLRMLRGRGPTPGDRRRREIRQDDGTCGALRALLRAERRGLQRAPVVQGEIGVGPRGALISRQLQQGRPDSCPYRAISDAKIGVAPGSDHRFL